MTQRYKLQNRMKALTLIRILMNGFLFLILFFLAFHHQTGIYLSYQAKGQLKILLGTTSLSEYRKQNNLNPSQRQNLNLIPSLKKFAVDSLGYKNSSSFESIYNQHEQPLLWVLTASEPYEIKAFTWTFPLVGTVSYKGYFDKSLALKEYIALIKKGYDVDLRTVSAWSTLGWLNDPILSSMLNRSKGSFCHLLFHELFHATFYSPNKVNLNENLADFVAHKATLKFLRVDSSALKQYLTATSDAEKLDNYLHRSRMQLKNYYSFIQNQPNKAELKLRAIQQICDSLSKFTHIDTKQQKRIRENILRAQNAYFIGFTQYNSLQDSLEGVFNKIYNGKIENLVRDLKLN